MGGVDLARHDGAARLVGRDAQLPETAARAAGKKANVIGDLHHIRGQRFHGPVGKDQLIQRGEGVKFIRCGHKCCAGKLCNLFRRLFGKARRGIQTRSDRRTAQSELPQRRQGKPKQFSITLQ